ARVLKGGESKFFHMTEPYLAMMDKMYVKLLKPLIRFKYFTIVGIFAMIFVVGGLLKHVGGDFVPMEDNSEFQVFIKAPVGISLDEMKRKTEPLAAKMKEDERVKYTIFSVGYNTAKDAHKARIYTKLVPVTEREEGQLEIIQEYREMFGKIQGMKVSVEKVSDFDTGGTQAPVQVVLKGPELGELDKISQKVQGLLREVDGVVDIDTDYETGKPEVKISILRENAKRLGISANDIALALGSSFSSDSAISTYEDEGRQFDITVRFSDENRMVLEDLKRIQIKTSSGELVSLEGVVKFEESLGTASINRFDRERKILITANLNGIPVGDVVAAVGDKLDALLPVGYTYRFTGDIENMADTNKAFGAAVGLAVILIFLILASLYESVIQPLIIMVAMPLSFIGVVLALFLTGKPFSLFVMIGIILLLGMVGKNSILIVDFANRAIKDGKSVDEALLEAGERRLRPIVMTTLAIIFAMIPLAFGSGAGHESNSPMAVAIIGGLLSSTILALFIVPAIYKILYPIDAFFRKFYDKDQIIAREAKQN
ncbi:MAG: efflux RND transporter permease subunit, partial [Campylobacterales bacterium]|nr:efflux RND transporter permease subunit [Campylobacterales bacterium]